MPAQTRDLVYNDIKNNIKEIHKLIDSVYEEACDLIQMENSLSVPYNLSIDLHIEALINKLSYELLRFLNPLALKTHRRFLVRLTEHENFDDNKKAKDLLSSFELPDSEIYDKIQTWISKLENLILENINDSENPVKVGGVMYLQWDEDYPHHATIISKIENDIIYYAAHTESRKEEKLSNFFKKDSQRTAYILKIK